MEFIDIPTEQTTAATDAISAGIAMIGAVYLRHIGKNSGWKTTLWVWVFGLLALAAILGSIAHGLKISEVAQTRLWYPLYLSLGLMIALFVVATAYEIWGEIIARKLLPVMLSIGVGFFSITIIWPDNFLVFIIYETLAMLFALGSYSLIAYRGYREGAGLIAAGILVTIIAAGVQASNAVSFTFIWAFDHNGIYHLIQMAGLVLLIVGLGKTLASRN